jgi:hypothetical protein
VNGMAVPNIRRVRPEKSEVGLDIYGMPGTLEERGLKHVDGPPD